MTNVCGLEAKKALQNLVTTAGVCELKLLPDGPLGMALFWFLILCGSVAPLVFKYYVGLVGQGRNQ